MYRHGSKPVNVFTRSSLFGRLGSYVPAPLKAFGAVATLAAATVVLAPALIILAGPPLLCGALLWRRRIKSLQLMAEQLHNQRWKDLASFHLHREPIRHTSSSFEAGRIPIHVQIVFEKAIGRNYQHVADLLGLKPDSDSHISYGLLRSLSQDFRLDPSGFTEKMSISEFPILVENRTKGVIRVISRGESEAQESRSRIEVECKNQIIILEQGANDDDVIEGDGRAIG